MTKLRPAFVTLIALLLLPVPARPQAVGRSCSAEFYVEGCNDKTASDRASLLAARYSYSPRLPKVSSLSRICRFASLML
jgi:hypothetical protein